MKLLRIVVVLSIYPATAIGDGIDNLAKALDPKLKPETMTVMGVIGKTLDSLRDPRSIQVKSLGYGRAPDTALGCMEYRAKNGFGGYVEGYSVWRMSLLEKKPSLLFTMDKPGDWNKYCSKASLKDVTDFGRVAAEKLAKSY